jgi:hypothetical protein
MADTTVTFSSLYGLTESVVIKDKGNTYLHPDPKTFAISSFIGLNRDRNLTV